MAKSAPQHEPAPLPASESWRQVNPWLRRGLTLFLLVHLASICVPPISVEPASLFSSYLWTGLQPYIQATFLDHGYRFFAPEPGPSHLVRYELTLPDGTQQEGIFPNLAEEWPRLLYHRHFMLSEFVNSLASYREEAELSYAKSYAHHLLRKHGANQVTLYLRRHAIPTPEQILDGMQLSDLRLLQERSLGTFTLDGHTPPENPEPKSLAPPEPAIEEVSATSATSLRNSERPLR
jgi:hypothetical protein